MIWKTDIPICWWLDFLFVQRKLTDLLSIERDYPWNFCSYRGNAVILNVFSSTADFCYSDTFPINFYWFPSLTINVCQFWFILLIQQFILKMTTSHDFVFCRLTLHSMRSVSLNSYGFVCTESWRNFIWKALDIPSTDSVVKINWSRQKVPRSLQSAICCDWEELSN